MKKLLLITMMLVAVATTSITAQSNKFGITLGTNFNKGKSIDGLNTKMDSGVLIGGKWQHFFGENLFTDLGLGFDGRELKYKPKVGYGEIKRTQFSLNVPIHLGYMHHFNNTVAIYGAAGPYFNIGLFGQYKLKGTDDFGDYDEGDQDLYESGSGDKRFEAGLGFRVGVQLINHIQISAGYDLGLTKLNKHVSEFQNRTFTLGIAYMF